MSVSTEEKTIEKSNKIVQRTGRYFYADGKRKTSIAKVRLYEKGSGDVVINNRSLDDYFFGTLIGNVLWPLKLTNMEKAFDIIVKVIGGGPNSQADAVRHGVAKALTVFDPNLRAVLKKAGLLSRDARIKERKKFGLKRARRAPQWAKR
ncbi:MAG: 30S ribosomal protein S9 [Candidatus Peregrinibacteria bacterium]